MSTSYGGNRVRFRKALDRIFAWQSLGAWCDGQASQTLNFCPDPDHYTWRHAGKRNMLIPFKCHQALNGQASQLPPPALFNRNVMRWELYPVWIADGRLRQGESNVLYRRRFYVDQSNWLILFGEGFDPADNMIKCYLLDAGGTPPMPVYGRWYRV